MIGAAGLWSVKFNSEMAPMPGWAAQQATEKDRYANTADCREPGRRVRSIASLKVKQVKVQAKV